MPGISFSPFNQPPQMGQGGPRPGGVTPIQDAIRMLSFRMPTTVGASSPAPQGIMGGQTAQGGQLGNPLALNWLRALFGGGQMPGAPLPGMGGGMPPGGAFGGIPGLSRQGPSEGADVTGGNPPAVGSPWGGGGGGLPVNFGFDEGGGGGGGSVAPPNPRIGQGGPAPTGGGPTFSNMNPSPYAGFNNFGQDYRFSGGGQPF